MTQRPIKFRVWDKDKKKIVDVQCVSNWSVDEGVDDYYESPQQTQDHTGNWHSRIVLMQFTGLLDRNGKEIFEGDILLNHFRNQKVEIYWRGCITDPNSVNGKHWIDWGGWGFRAIKNNDELTYRTHDNEIEIIGNIYENPELLTPQAL